MPRFASRSMRPAIVVEGRRGRWAWQAALLAAVGLLVWESTQQARHYAQVSSTYGVAVRAPAADDGSPTGWADGRRNYVYPARWVDGQHWIMHTQQMLAKGEPRVRRVDQENTPFGREVHWASPFRWWIALCAWLDHAVSGEPIGGVTERAALFANPSLLAVLLLAVVPWTARRFGSAAAAFLALAMVACPPFHAMFAPDNMDHHGLIQGCMLVLILGILAGGGGWIRRKEAKAASHLLPTPNEAKCAFTLSGIAAGFGLWISAASMIPALAAIAIGALGVAWFARNAGAVADSEFGLWRCWGMAGALVSAAGYLLEYFPNHVAWRLEVNHPLYALALLGAGEMLAQATSVLAGAAEPAIRWRRVRLAVAALALAAPLIAVLIAGERVFGVSDPFLWSLAHDYTPEGRSMVFALRRAGTNVETIASVLPMAVVPLVAGWMARRTMPAFVPAWLLIPLVGAALFWLMALRELRWWPVGFPFLLALGTAGVAVMAGNASRGLRWTGAILVVALFGPGFAVTARTVAKGPEPTADDVYSLAERDLAHALRQRVGSDPLVVLSSPATTSRLMYFASATGMGTAYWENVDGMKRAAAVFAARTAEEARAQVQAAGVTHVVLLSWDDFVEPYVRLARGLSPSAPIVEPAFGLALMRGEEPPPWLRRIPEHLPPLALLQNERVLIFEVTSRTSTEEVLVRHARDLLGRGDPAGARRRMPELQQLNGNLAAQVALARIHLAAEDRAGLTAALTRIVALAGSGAQLEPDDQLDLIALLALGGYEAEARRQFEPTLGALDERAIRRLAPTALENLLALADRFGVAWPNSRLRDLAVELIPPDGRF